MEEWAIKKSKTKKRSTHELCIVIQTHQRMKTKKFGMPYVLVPYIHGFGYARRWKN